jgi:hypothetical protein
MLAISSRNSCVLSEREGIFTLRDIYVKLFETSVYIYIHVGIIVDNEFFPRD